MTKGVWQGGDMLRRRSEAAKKGARSRKAKALHAALTDPNAPPVKAPRRGSKMLAPEDCSPAALMRRALDGLKAKEATRG